MRFSPILLLLPFAVTAITDDDIKSMASQCCSAANQQCCQDVIQFRKSLDCSVNEEENLKNVKCLENLMEEKLKYSHKNVGISDIGCCEVFAVNDNDPSGYCQSSCEKTMKSPALSEKEKLRNIKNCMIKNPLFRCFRKCQSHLRSAPLSTDSASSTPVPFDPIGSCSIFSRMKEGRIYLTGRLEVPDQ